MNGVDLGWWFEYKFLAVQAVVVLVFRVNWPDMRK
jgi:hypothetical protein